MKNYKELEELIRSSVKVYQERFNTINTEHEVEFSLTLTNHKIKVGKVSKWAAYLRLERKTKPRGGSDEEWESLLIYNQAYKFNTVKERLNEKAPWKVELYLDLLVKLVAGGLEYGELLKRLQTMTKDTKGNPISEVVMPKEPKIMVTDKMPEPLTQTEKEYVEWIKKNGQQEKK